MSSFVAVIPAAQSEAAKTAALPTSAGVAARPVMVRAAVAWVTVSRSSGGHLEPAQVVVAQRVAVAAEGEDHPGALTDHASRAAPPVARMPSATATSDSGVRPARWTVAPLAGKGARDAGPDRAGAAVDDGVAVFEQH